MGRRQSVFNKRSQDQVAAARNKPTVTGGGLLPTAHAQSASNPTQNRLQQAAQRKEGPLERVGRFVRNIGVGGYGTVRGYTTDMYTAGRSLATGEDDPVDSRSYRDDALVSMASRGIMEGKYDEVWEEAGRRVTEEPGRVVGEVAAETAIMLGTMGFGAAWKGGRIGMGAGRELSRLGQKGYLRNTGYFRKGTEAKFIGDRRTIITTTSHKGKVKTRNKRTNTFDRIERKAIALTEKYNKNKKIPKIITVSGSSVLAAQTIGGGVIGARNARGVGGGFAAIGGGGTALQDNVVFKGGMTKETLEAAIKENTIENKIQSLTPSGDPSSLRYGDEFYGSAGPMKVYTFNTYKANRRGPRWKQYPKGETVEKGVTPGPRGVPENISFIGPKLPFKDEGLETITHRSEFRDNVPQEVRNAINLPYNFKTFGELDADTLSTMKFKSNYVRDGQMIPELKTYFKSAIDETELPDSMASDTQYAENPMAKQTANDMASIFDPESGLSYERVRGMPAPALSVTKEDTMELIEASIVRSATIGDDKNTAKLKAQQYLTEILAERAAQQAKLAEFQTAKKLKGDKFQGNVMSKKFDKFGNLITGTSKQIDEAEGAVITKTLEPAEESMLLGTDTFARKGLDVDGRPSRSVFRPIGLDTDLMLTQDATREIEPDPEKYTGVIKIISGGQTGVDQTAVAAWSKKEGRTGGTMPSGWITEDGDALKYTAENTTRLNPNQIFVYGANKDYKNYGGAAGDARRYFGAGGGNPEKGYKGAKGGPGIVGQSYGVITKKAPNNAPESFYSKTPEGKAIVKAEVEKLVETMKANPDKEFVLTDFGTQMAGFKHSDIVEMFGDAILQPNAVLPKGFYKQLKKSKQLEYDNIRKNTSSYGELFGKKYGLDESDSDDYVDRMNLNVINSDVTIIFGNVRGKGTMGTINTAMERGRPVLINPKTAAEVNAFTKLHNAHIVNIAGTRGSHINDTKLLKNVSKIVSGIKKAKKGTHLPKGRRSYTEKQYMNPYEPGAGDAFEDLSKLNIVPGNIVYSYSKSVNAKGKLPIKNKPPKDENELLASIRSEYDFEVKKREQSFQTNPSTGITEKFDSTPSGFNPLFSDSSLKDIESFRLAKGYSSLDNVGKDEFAEAFTNINSPGIKDEFENFRSFTILSGKYGPIFSSKLREQIGPGVLRRYREKYNVGNTTSKTDSLVETKKLLDKSFLEKGATPEWRIMQKAYMKQIGDVNSGKTTSTKTDDQLWEMYMEKEVRPSGRLTASEWLSGTKSSETRMVPMFINPVTTTKGIPKGGTALVKRNMPLTPMDASKITVSVNNPYFDAFRLLTGKRAPGSKNSFALGDRVTKQKKKIRTQTYGGKQEVMDDNYTFGDPRKLIYPTTDSEIFNIGTQNNIRKYKVDGKMRTFNFKFGENDPFKYKVGSKERKELMRRNRDIRSKELSINPGIPTFISRNRETKKQAKKTGWRKGPDRRNASNVNRGPGDIELGGFDLNDSISEGYYGGDSIN